MMHGQKNIKFCSTFYAVTATQAQIWSAYGRNEIHFYTERRRDNYT